MSALFTLLMIIGSAFCSTTPAHPSLLLDEIYQEALGKLPPSLTSYLESSVELYLTPISGNVVARTSGLSRIEVDPVILEYYQDTENKAWLKNNPEEVLPVAHGTARTYAIATVIHELLHIYDMKKALPQKEEAAIANCESNTKYCKELKRMKFSISDSPFFLDIAGWRSTGLLNRSRKQANFNYERSPDSYEFHSPQENFAVNGEYFFTDPEYRCRRPAYYKYFKTAFNFEPFPYSDCESYTELDFTLRNDVYKRKHSLDISPHRIYQIHYLFAGKGSAVMSRWGHSMIRLIVCAPNREKVNSQCMEDTAYHLVLSYVADTQGGSTNYIKGIFGGYESVMTISSFEDTINEYTKVELREVYSLPLELDQFEITTFVHNILTSHWEYGGDYRFFANNCATETANLIKRSSFSRQLTNRLTATTPLQLFKRLKKSSLATETIFEDKMKAREQGLYFPGLEKQLEEYLANLKNAGVIKVDKLKSYIDDSTLEKRHQWIEETDSKADLAKLYRLESFRLQTLNSEVSSVMFSFLLAVDKTPEDYDQETVDWVQNVKDTAKLENPHQNQVSGYGIPTLADIEDAQTISRQVNEEALSLKKKLWGKIQDTVPKEIKKLQSKISSTVELKKTILKKIQRLNQVNTIY